MRQLRILVHKDTVDKAILVARVNKVDVNEMLRQHIEKSLTEEIQSEEFQTKRNDMHLDRTPNTPEPVTDEQAIAMRSLMKVVQKEG
jgi:hypothetical protein